MQIKKEIFLFGLLIVFSIGLLIASNTSERVEPCAVKGGKLNDCCQEMMKEKSESPWNFITGGILHLYV